MQFLIGTDGRRWQPEGTAFAGHFGFSGSCEESVDHAVRSLGQVSLHISPRRYRVRLCPEALTWVAFQQLIFDMLDDETKPVVLEIDGGAEFPTEIYGDVEDAIARIDDLRAMNPRIAGPQWRASFIEEPLSLQRLKTPMRNDLRQTHRHWVRRGGVLDAATLRRLRDAPFEAPMLLARIGRGGRPVAETWPGYIELYDSDLVPALIGRPLDEHPLQSYSIRAAHGLCETDRDRAPRLELIEAVVEPEGRSTQRLRYERLLLPWQGQDGTRYVSSHWRQLWRRPSACPPC